MLLKQYIEPSSSIPTSQKYVDQQLCDQNVYGYKIIIYNIAKIAKKNVIFFITPPNSTFTYIYKQLVYQRYILGFN